MRRFKRRVQLPPPEAETTWAGPIRENPNSSYLFFYSGFFWTNSKSVNSFKTKEIQFKKTQNEIEI
jgi:hypothetical protein